MPRVPNVAGTKQSTPTSNFGSVTSDKPDYHWVLGYTDSGKRCVLGPYNDETEASVFMEKLNEAEVFALKTRNQSSAVKQIRAILLRQGEVVDDAVSRQLHEKGLKQELERQQR